MFIEPQRHLGKNGEPQGWIEVICGSMFSGKTEELLRRVRRAVIAQQTVQIFKPTIDVRYDEKNVVSHDRNSIRSVSASTAAEILEKCEDVDVIAVDEVQFFDMHLVEVCTTLANKGYRVICSGLDMDFEGKPFGPVSGLMAVAEYVTKLHAICMKCGSMASYSFRLVDSHDQVLLGEKDAYEARCRKCFLEGQQKQAIPKEENMTKTVR